MLISVPSAVRPTPTLVKFQRWMKCRATSRAALPCTTEEMSCQGILGVVYLSMKSVGQGSMAELPQTKDMSVEKHSIPLLRLRFLAPSTPKADDLDCNSITGPKIPQREFCYFCLATKPNQTSLVTSGLEAGKIRSETEKVLKKVWEMQRLPLTSKRLVELNPVFKDKVAIVFSVPKPGFPKQFSNTCL